MINRTLFLALILLTSPSIAQTVGSQTGPTSTGVVLADRSVTLAAKIVGRVTAVNVEEGDTVEANALLIDIGDAELRADLAAATAQLKREELNRAHMKKLSERMAILHKQNAASQENLDDVSFRYAAAEEMIAGARAALARAEARLDETKIKAPFSGIVIEKRVEIGDVTSPGEPLLRLENHEKLKFRTSVKEQDVVRINVGQKVTITIDALDDLRLEATVNKIIPSGNTSTHEFVVEAVLPRHDKLYPGMFGKAEFLE